MKIILMILFLSMVVPGYSQDYQPEVREVMDEIMQNNTTLKALEEKAAADSLHNKTGLYPNNPTLDVGYLIGSPDAIGNRTDINLMQQFDFPTSYAHRSSISDLRNQQVGIRLLKYKKDLMLQTHQLYIEATYLNAMIDQYRTRSENAVQLEEAFNTMLEAGETNILEVNKAKINRINIQNRMERLVIQKETIEKTLTQLNGGNEISVSSDDFGNVFIPADFDTWYENVENINPEISSILAEISTSEKNEQLQRSLSLPNLGVGYRSETLTDEQFNGVVGSITIPLFENKNRVKHARAQTLSLREKENDIRVQFRNHLLSKYQSALSLQDALQEYEDIFGSGNHEELLRKAWEQGQTPLTTYLTELTFYYEGMDNMLETEYQLHEEAAIFKLYENRIFED